VNCGGGDEKVNSNTFLFFFRAKNVQSEGGTSQFFFTCLSEDIIDEILS
jgi:hypothetical protein